LPTATCCRPLATDASVLRYPLCGAPNTARETLSAFLAFPRHGVSPQKCSTRINVTGPRNSPRWRQRRPAPGPLPDNFLRALPNDVSMPRSLLRFAPQISKAPRAQCHLGTFLPCKLQKQPMNRGFCIPKWSKNLQAQQAARCGRFYLPPFCQHSAPLSRRRGQSPLAGTAVSQGTPPLSVVSAQGIGGVPPARASRPSAKSRRAVPLQRHCVGSKPRKARFPAKGNDPLF
jgi:hypothetical protein